MNNKEIKKNAEFLKAMGHPTRFIMLKELLRAEALPVSELVNRAGVQQSTVSQHLAILRRTGLVENEKKGLEVYYSIESLAVKNIMSIMLGSKE